MKNLCLTILVVFPAYLFSQNDAIGFKMTGDKYFHEGEYKKAIEQYTKAIKADKKFTEAYFWRAGAKVELEDLKGAVNDFNSVLKLDPLNVNALISRGITWGGMKKYDEAEADYLKALKLAPEEASIWYNRGYTLRNKGDCNKAVMCFTKAMEYGDTNIKTREFRAECYNTLGQDENCISELFFIVRADSTNYWARNNLAFMLSSKNDFKQADSLYAISLKKTPRDAYVLSNYGYVKFKLGLVKEGKEMLEQSIFIMPENSYSYHYLARIADEENNAEAACDYAKKAIARGFTKSYGNAMADLQAKHCK